MNERARVLIGTLVGLAFGIVLANAASWLSCVVLAALAIVVFGVVVTSRAN